MELCVVIGGERQMCIRESGDTGPSVVATTCAERRLESTERSHFVMRLAAYGFDVGLEMWDRAFRLGEFNTINRCQSTSQLCKRIAGEVLSACFENLCSFGGSSHEVEEAIELTENFLLVTA